MPPNWLVAVAIQEGAEIRWEWQEQRLAVFDKLESAYRGDGWLCAIFGLVGGECVSFGYRMADEDLNALLDSLAKNYRPYVT
jgi:hypothetical protein